MVWQSGNARDAAKRKMEILMARSLSATDGNKGDNSAGMIDGEALRRYVSRAMALLEGRDALGEDLKEVYAEAKEAGFVTTQLRQIVKEQRMEPLTLQSHLDAMDMLRHALGGLVDTPLGKAAMREQEEAPPVNRGRGQPRSKVAYTMQAAQEHLGNGPYQLPENELA